MYISILSLANCFKLSIEKKKQVGLDEVIFGKYGGTEIEVDGTEVKILRESDILAKVL